MSGGKSLRLFWRQKVALEIEITPILIKDGAEYEELSNINTESLDLSGNGLGFLSQQSLLDQGIEYLLIRRVEGIEERDIAVGKIAREIKKPDGLLIGVFFLVIKDEFQDVIIKKVNKLTRDQIQIIKKGRISN